MERPIGVFGEDLLLWLCLLCQTSERADQPEAHEVLAHANRLLDELKASEQARLLPVESVDDGCFAIAALIDELAMTMPDLRPVWQQASLQATRFSTSNAGVEVFERLDRVRRGPRSVLATYSVVLALGFQGCYGLQGADRQVFLQLRRELGAELGADPDRDFQGGVLRAVRAEEVEDLEAFREPWYRSLWAGRLLATLILSGAILVLALAILERTG